MDKKINVPFDFEMGGKVKGVIITGPNTGGKTVAIKTVALNCLMAQCGLHVTCREAEICLNNQILCGIGDSVMIYPDKKIGIVCEPVNEKGVLRIQLPDKKIYINHKRVKLHVKADQLYPEDYDFSIIFDTVENRKMRHQMERKYVENGIVEYEE